MQQPAHASPHDSDSEEEEFVGEWNLGFVEPPQKPTDLLRHRFPSKVGGRPAWLDPLHLPTPDQLTCKATGKQLQFLLQVRREAGGGRAGRLAAGSRHAGLTRAQLASCACQRATLRAAQTLKEVAGYFVPLPRSMRQWTRTPTPSTAPSLSSPRPRCGSAYIVPGSSRRRAC